jgi:hypothetical protein
MKTIIIAMLLISITTIASAQFRSTLPTAQDYRLQQQQQRHNQYNDNQMIIDNRPNRYGQPSVTYQRSGNMIFGSDGTNCIIMDGMTVCN